MILAIVLLYVNMDERIRRTQNDSSHLKAWLLAVIAWNLYMFLTTEVLSLFLAVHRVPIVLSWLILDVFLLFILHTQKKQITYIRILKSSLIDPVKQLKRNLNIQSCFFFVLCAVAVYLAFVMVPYNWDSMTYHLSRIAHWSQNGTVAHYATNIIRQLASPVLAEFVNLHVYVISGQSDRFFNLLQCFSYITNGVIISGICSKLKCNKTFSQLAVLLWLTMPSAFAEALTTQVDQFATLWLLIFVYFLLDFTTKIEQITFSRQSVIGVCALGLCVSLGYLTKPSISVGMLIFVIWLLILAIYRRANWTSLWKLIFVTLPAIVLPLIPEMARNLITFQALSDPIAGQRQLVGTIKPTYVFVNFLKNIAFNIPNRYIPGLSNLAVRTIRKISEILHVPLDDPTISENGASFYLHEAGNYVHDTAVNPVILILSVVCVIWFLCRTKRKERKGTQIGYCITAFCSFFIFCAVLRWEPFVSRYMLSYMALLCPAIAIMMQDLTNNKHVLMKYSAIGIAWVVSLVELMGNVTYHEQLYSQERLEGLRPYSYFLHRGNEYQPYTDICKTLTDGKYKQIGLYLTENDYEYPIWAMVAEAENSPLRIEHVNVNNVSNRYLDESFVPDCIIWVGGYPENGFSHNGKQYNVFYTASEGHYLLTVN